ncbi:hypothetical protein [Pseudonocardia sp. WMMC193]|uniref:hypothetical protein n=1 Tax=Pseudonocardia sp. WMMC193 TaxID=2911965 RepID=UPI001F3DE975|nr:hypothetical protein [Pseudonocardia sp. WMMC193]MCF7548169.1 hypothetical protein [Pseudonocardia sp. WMMC193]
MSNTFQLGGDVFEVRSDVTHETGSEFTRLMQSGHVVDALSLVVVGRADAKRVAELIAALPSPLHIDRALLSISYQAFENSGGDR